MGIKKSLKRLIAIVLSLAAAVMPVYAQEEKPILKLEDAIKSGIAYSTQASIKSKEHENLKEQLKLNNEATYYQYQTIYLKKAQNEQQKKMLEEQIGNDITDKYMTLIILQKEIDTMAKNLALKAKELRQLAIKNEKGLYNPLTYQSKEIDLTNLKTKKTAKEEEFKNAQAYFKIVTGKDVTKYILEDNMSYEPFRIQGSVEGFFSSKIDTYLQYDKELAELKANNLIEDNSQPMFYSQYLENKTSAETITLQLEDTQKSLKQSLMNSYSTLLNLEEQIDTSTLELEILKKNLKAAEIRYAHGQISIIEYDKQVLAKEQAELDILKLIVNYNNAKEKIQKPWIGRI